MYQTRKIGVVGQGHVGAHVANSLLMQGIADELYLCDINEAKVTSEVQDLRDSLSFVPYNTKIVNCYDHYEDFLKIPYTAFILIFELFCSLIFKILTQIALSSCNLYIIQSFFSDNKLAILYLVFHFFNIICCQFIMHILSPFQICTRNLNLYVICGYSKPLFTIKVRQLRIEELPLPKLFDTSQIL